MYSRRQRYFSLTTLRRLRTAAKTYGLCSQPNATFAKAIAYNFRLQQMFNCLHPDQVRCGGRIQCAENPRCIRITHYSRESTAKSWKRVRYAVSPWADIEFTRAHCSYLGISNVLISRVRRLPTFLRIGRPFSRVASCRPVRYQTRAVQQTLI